MLRRLIPRGRLVEGEFRPGGSAREWCAPDVLRLARRRSLARLRHEAAPVEPRVLGRFLTKWQGVASGRRGLDALLDAIENLQGAPVPASVLETDILPARVTDYDPADLDRLAAAGEITWLGVEPLGQRDGRIALYLTDHLPRLAPPGPAEGRGTAPASTLDERQHALVDALRRSGASFFGPLHEAAGGGFPGETLDALWALVWKGLVTNDAFQALRMYVRPPERGRLKKSDGTVFRSRRLAPPSSEGRWSLVERPTFSHRAATTWAAATAEQWLSRYGVVTREVASLEGTPGGFSAIYPVLRSLDDAGRIRRGYFAAGVPATQFARPAAIELLRALRTPADEPEAVVLASTDPANPYGGLLRWPALPTDESGTLPAFARTVGAMVALVEGTLAAFWRIGNPEIGVLLPEAEPERSRAARALAARLADVAVHGEGRRGGLLVGTINGRPARAHPFGPFLVAAGFVHSAMGYHRPRR